VLTSWGLYFSWAMAAAASEPGAMASGKSMVMLNSANLQQKLAR